MSWSYKLGHKYSLGDLLACWSQVILIKAINALPLIHKGGIVMVFLLMRQLSAL